MAKVWIFELSEKDCARLIKGLSDHECICLNAVPTDPQATADIAIVCWEGKNAGPEALIELRRQWPDIPVIATSSSWDLSRVARAKQWGGKEFIAKPVDLPKLRDLIVKHLGFHVDPTLLEKLSKIIVGTSPPVKALLRSITSVMSAGGQVLVTGENGTGKELVAQAIHAGNANEVFLGINISAIPEAMVESELFGHEKGAFTGAIARKLGAFELCGKGILFLDEIGESSPTVQAKLLRAIQERQFYRVGGTEAVHFEGRLVTATNRNLLDMVTSKTFREDLYHRLTTHVLATVPLRERGTDIPLLIQHFIKKHGNSREVTMSPEARDILLAYPFPGNIRELENFILHALAQSSSKSISIGDLPVQEMQKRAEAFESSRASQPLSVNPSWYGMQYKDAMAEVERKFGREYFSRLLKKHNGKIAPAAREADLDEKTFRKKCVGAELIKPTMDEDSKDDGSKDGSS